MYIHPTSVTSVGTELELPELFSANISCPSLSPSPSPIPNSTSQASKSTNFEFCDPRHLTVGTGESVINVSTEVKFPPLPALGSEDALADAAQTPASLDSSFTCPLDDTHAALPAFEPLLESDSEEGFNSFVAFTTTADSVVFNGG